MAEEQETNQQPKQMNKNMWWVLLIVVLIAGALAFFMMSDDDGDDDENAADTEDVVDVEDDDSEDLATDEMQMIETTTLASVGNYTGDGDATRSWDGSTFTHTVEARIGDPAEGKFYEGWLVNGSIESTGALDKNSDGVWVLSFETNEDLTGHTNVVITEETEANGLDGVPEAHVLEGEFSS